MDNETTLPIFGAEHSATGNNAYYLAGCRHVCHRPAYASCLSKIAERKKGRLEGDADCSAAIGRKDCPALAMKREEELAGKAIYFVNRKQLQEEMRIAAEARGQVFARMAEQGKDWAPSKTKRPKTTATPATAPVAALGIDYAAAINKAIAAAKAAAPVAPAAPVSSADAPAEPKAPASSALKSVSADLARKPSTPPTGMSMLEFARNARNRAAAAAA